MELNEVEVKPGIYMTDYRKKNEKKVICLSSEEYRMELQQKGYASDELLRGERLRFENSVRMLRETNEELKNDESLGEIVKDNEEVIERHLGYIEVLNTLLGESHSVYL
jgi:hypothetical protein